MTTASTTYRFIYTHDRATQIDKVYINREALYILDMNFTLKYPNCCIPGCSVILGGSLCTSTGSLFFFVFQVVLQPHSRLPCAAPPENHSLFLLSFYLEMHAVAIFPHLTLQEYIQPFNADVISPQLPLFHIISAFCTIIVQKNVKITWTIPDGVHQEVVRRLELSPFIPDTMLCQLCGIGENTQKFQLVTR